MCPSPWLFVALTTQIQGHLLSGHRGSTGSTQMPLRRFSNTTRQQRALSRTASGRPPHLTLAPQRHALNTQTTRTFHLAGAASRRWASLTLGRAGTWSFGMRNTSLSFLQAQRSSFPPPRLLTQMFQYRAGNAASHSPSIPPGAFFGGWTSPYTINKHCKKTPWFCDPSGSYENLKSR